MRLTARGRRAFQAGLFSGSRTVAPAAPTAFAPNQLPGLITWYDAADAASITLVGGKISQINDKSTSVVHLIQNTDANRPVSSGGIAPPNALSYASFVGATPTHLMSTAANIAAGDATSFVSGYLRSTAPSGARMFVWARTGLSDTGANATLLHFVATGQAMSIYGGTGTASQAVVYDQWFVHCATRLAAEVRSAVNGAADTVVTASVTAPSGPITRLCIGTGLASASFNPSGGWEGGLGEQFAYSRLLNATEKAMCEGYLAWKWGTQALLPAGHAWKAGAPPPL